MKKTMLSICLVVLMVCSFSPLSAFAANSNTSMNNSIERTTVYSAMEIIDEEVILERAKANVHEASIEIVSKMISGAQLNGIQLDEGVVLSTSQLLQKTMKSNGDIESHYALDLIVDVILNDDMTLTATNYTKEEDELEPGGEARIYAKIYYEVGEVNSIPYIKLTGVQGTYKVLYSGTKASNGQVRYGWRGFVLPQVRYEDYTSSWRSRASGSKLSVSGKQLEASEGAYSYIWGEVQCTLTRGSSTWTASLLVTETNVPWP